MRTVLFCLEEPSAKEMLRGILPRLLPPGVTPRYLVFRGKQDLEKQLVKRLRGWRQPNTTFVVMRDQDSGDCKIIKEKLTNLCVEAGRDTALIRIACHELESFGCRATMKKMPGQPSHLDTIIREDYLLPLSLTITNMASVLGVSRKPCQRSSFMRNAG